MTRAEAIVKLKNIPIIHDPDVQLIAALETLGLLKFEEAGYTEATKVKIEPSKPSVEIVDKDQLSPHTINMTTKQTIVHSGQRVIATDGKVYTVAFVRNGQVWAYAYRCLRRITVSS